MDAMRRDLVFLLILFTLVAVIRVTAPSDLATGDQPYQADYIRDITERGSWIVQHLRDGTPASKPPLYNWLAAVPIIITGQSSDFLLKLPSLLAGLGTLLLTVSIGRKIGGDRVALYAGVLLICSTMYSKQIYFARTDMLLAMFVAAQIWAAVFLRPALFWIAGSLSLLTKGPVGMAMVFLTLGAWWWHEGVLRERVRAMRVLPGLALASIPLAAWFAAALWTGGAEVWEQIVVRETVDRFTAGSKSMEHRHVFYYLPHFLARMAPASFLAIAALLAVGWRRAQRDHAIAVAAWWVVAPLVMLSMVPSKRADRMFPIFPAVCILAAWAIDRWARRDPVRGTGVLLRLIAVLIASAGNGLIVIVLTGYGDFEPRLRPVLAAGGIALALGGAAMFVAIVRHHANGFVGALAATMLVAIFLYQHHLSVPAREVWRAGLTPNATHALPCRPHGNARSCR